MTKQLPKISIIIPVYNVAEYIIECIHSVIRQTYKGEIECILVDDCGKDDSIAIAEQLIADYEGAIAFRIVHHVHNRGLSAARNTGTDVATGDYIYYLDSDDWIDENTIEVLYDSISESDYVIAIGYAKINQDAIFKEEWVFDNKKELPSDQFLNQMLMQKSIFTAWGKLFKKDVIGDVRFREGRLNEDTLFMIDLAPKIEEHQYKCIELPLYSYHYRMREESICHMSTYKMDPMYVENIQIAIDRYRDRKELMEWLKKDQFARCLKVLRNSEIDKMFYIRVAKYLHYFSNYYIHAQKRSCRTFLHLLMIKYMPRLMWHVEHN